MNTLGSTIFHVGRLRAFVEESLQQRHCYTHCTQDGTKAIALKQKLDVKAQLDNMLVLFHNFSLEFLRVLIRMQLVLGGGQGKIISPCITFIILFMVIHFF